jgi:hypothetical protein
LVGVGWLVVMFDFGMVNRRTISFDRSLVTDGRFKFQLTGFAPVLSGKCMDLKLTFSAKTSKNATKKQFKLQAFSEARLQYLYKTQLNP